MLKDVEVEWKELGEVCDITTGESVSKNKITKNPGKYPVINSGKDPLGYINTWNTEDDPIGITSRGAGVGSITYQEGKYFRGNLNYSVSIINEEMLTVKYLYYILTNSGKEISNLCVYNSIPALNKSSLITLKIPVPPLEIQKEISKTLDIFTKYVTELQAELQARSKQYSYYRNLLLSEQYLTRLSAELDKLEDEEREVVWSLLSDVATLHRGKRVVKKDLTENGKYAVYQNSMTPLGYYGDNNREGGMSFIVTAGSAGEVGYSETDFWAADDVYTIEGSDKLLDKYIYYVLKNKESYLKSKVRRASVPRLPKIIMENLEIPVPPLDIQEKVVQVLDKFQSLIAETSGLLPKEREQRQKQYEYYRNKLLSFDINDDIMGENRTEQNRTEQNRTEQNRTEQNRTLREQSCTLIPVAYYNVLREAAKCVGVKFKTKKVDKIDLNTLTSYSSDKIDASELDANNYIGVANLLQDKMGKEKSEYVPDEGNYTMFNSGDVLVGNIRPYLRKIWLSDTVGGTNGDVLVFQINSSCKNQLSSEYLYQVLASEKFFRYDIKHSRGAKMPRGDKKKIMQYEIPVPSQKVQEHVVSILDQFETLVNDLQKGLPREIELRQKQYEYYRNRLLSFGREE